MGSDIRGDSLLPYEHILIINHGIQTEERVIDIYRSNTFISKNPQKIIQLTWVDEVEGIKLLLLLGGRGKVNVDLD